MNVRLNRREFLSSAALAGTAGLIGSLTSCRAERGPLLPESEWNVPAFLPDRADDGAPLKAGLIGCGNRGLGAVGDLLAAAPNVSIVSLGDLFQDQVAIARRKIKEDFKQDIPESNCFTGFDSYRKVLEAGVDMVLLATPPVFRPVHFKAAVEAGKHAFLEKPVAVDPAGVRRIIASSKIASSKGLCVITGTQRHHNREYIEGYKQVQRGLIGEIVSGKVCWNTGSHWYRMKRPEWTDMEWMIRDWGNRIWLSGDHIVEQHIHNLDVFNWFSGRKPVTASGMGAHQRRNTGDQYDMFSVDFVYEGGISVHSICRQIDGCSNNIYELIQGTEGSWSNREGIKDLRGNPVWKYDKEKSTFKQTNAFVLEHVNWVNHIRKNQPVNQAEETALSTLTAIMGRMSAYTGQDITWDQALTADLDLLPSALELGNPDMSAYQVPVPGKATGRKDNQR
ncbi:MAG: Gfo/Idh/MocA family oxidoreductase [Tannerella sp.]|jgi:predicted dehydrogenase|nr:Gfo/Idh/MocA family oxidoreductase [Tannerella sp.]